MKAEGKKLTLDRRLWVHYDGVSVKESGDERVLTAHDEDAWLKVLNHFGRVHKLFTFADGTWLDAETGLPPESLDESQAGHLPKGQALKASPKKAPVKKAAALKAAPKKNEKAATKSKRSKAGSSSKT